MEIITLPRGPMTPRDELSPKKVTATCSCSPINIIPPAGFQIESMQSKSTKYTYDAVGNLTLVDYANSPDLNFTYDALNRLTKDVSAGQFTNQYTYTSYSALKTENGPWASDTVTSS